MPPLLLSEADVRKVLTMKDAIDGLEMAYKQEAEGRAGYRPKTTVYVGSQERHLTHVTSLGGLDDPGMVCLNIRSNVIGAKDNSGGTYMNMLFSGETGELLTMMSTGGISWYRVAGSAALAARDMALPGAKVVGILGSGNSARPHPLAYAEVRDIELFKIFSPNPEHRKAFAEWTTEKTGIPAQALDNPEEVIRGSDIIAACTNTRDEPIIKKEWLDVPGLHMTAVQSGTGAAELELEGLKMFTRLVTSFDGPTVHVPTRPGKWTGGAEDEESMKRFDVIPNHHTLAELVGGKVPGRESPEERNYYLNQGTGVQYAGVAIKVYQRALEEGIGTRMPEEWFKWFQMGQRGLWT